MPKSPLIKAEGTTGTKILRGRDVEFLLQGKVDPIVKDILVQLAEIQHTNTLAVAELATHQDQIINIVQQFADVAQNMKDRTEQLVRSTEQMKDASEGDLDS